MMKLSFLVIVEVILVSFRLFMPTDINETLSSSTQMSTVLENTQSPSPPQTTTIRSNSPNQSSVKQLEKLRRFLSTLYYFGSDISHDIGERVRALILALIVR